VVDSSCKYQILKEERERAAEGERAEEEDLSRGQKTTFNPHLDMENVQQRKIRRRWKKYDDGKW